VPFGCLTTRPYDPCVVTFHCTSVYVCSPIAANIVAPAQHKNRPRKQKPRVSGALTGATEGLGGEGGPLSLKQPRHRDLVRKENPTARVRGIPAIPRRSPRTPFPRSPPVWMNGRLERWRKGVRKQKRSWFSLLRPGGGFLDRTITDADDKTAVPSITIGKNSIHYQFVRMLKLVESLAARAKRARSTTVVFVPLGESVSHRCSWCGRFAKGTPKGWNGYRAVDECCRRRLLGQRMQD
jgi:hypothetical protein